MNNRESLYTFDLEGACKHALELSAYQAMVVKP